ncbi:unnamed protein product [Prunus brigantina]
MQEKGLLELQGRELTVKLSQSKILKLLQQTPLRLTSSKPLWFQGYQSLYKHSVMIGSIFTNSVFPASTSMVANATMDQPLST